MNLKSYVCLLRGINVGGKKSIKMKDLLDMFERLNFSNCKSYIQSGNIIFDSSETLESVLSEKIKTGIQDTFGFEVPVLVFSKDSFEQIIKSQPFDINSITEFGGIHITFLDQIPSEEIQNKVNTLPQEKDTFIIKNQAVYLLCSARYSDSKFSNNFFESKLKTQATTRNWETCRKLVELF